MNEKIPKTRLIRDALKVDAVKQPTRYIVNALREQARSHKDTARLSE